MTDGDSAPTVEVWFRNPPPDGAQSAVERVRSRLVDLADEGRIADWSVNPWRKYVAVDPSDAYTDQEARTSLRVKTFEAWSDETDHDLEPVFRHRTESDEYADSPRDIVVLPIIGLAVTDPDGRLLLVAPCRTETVDDCLDRIETDDLPAPTTVRLPEPLTSPGQS